MATSTLEQDVQRHVGGVIWPQIQQLFNIHIVKYINTNDRITDTIIGVMANAAFALFGSLLYYLTLSIYALVMRMIFGNGIVNQFDPTYVIKFYKIDDVIKYPHQFKVYWWLDINQNLILEWIKENKVFGSTLTTVYGKEVVYTISNGDYQISESSWDNNSADNLYVPVRKYYNKSSYFPEYIFLHKRRLYSQCSVELENFITTVQKWNKERKENKKLIGRKDGKRQIWELDVYRNSGYHSSGFLQSISFDKLFLKEKDLILLWLQKFKTGTMYPSGLPLANKVGFLFYGPPGTGKTGTVSAICQYLERDMVLMDEKICAYEENVVELFREKGWIETSVFFFDEFDHLLKKIIPPPEKDTPKETSSAGDMAAAILAASMTQESDKDKKGDKEKPKTKMSYDTLLKLLDGAHDDTNRVIAATTNNLQDIDPTLIRPGRFDAVIELGYVDFSLFMNITRTVFPQVSEVENDEKFIERIKTILSTINFTPLELINKVVIAPGLDSFLLSFN